MRRFAPEEIAEVWERLRKAPNLGVGIENQFKKVYVVVDHYKVTVVEKKTGEFLSQQRSNVRSKLSLPNY